MRKSNVKILPQINIMNAALCLFVVMIHLTFAPLSELTVKSLPHIAVFIANKSLCFCVPAFIFLSGFKLFKSYEKRPFKANSFFLRRFTKIAIPYFIAVLLYIIYFKSKGWLEDGILKALFLGTVSAHFYYIIIILQLYILFPLILKLFKGNSGAVLILSLFVTLFCAVFLNTGYWDRFFGTYIFYFVFGMFWAKNYLYKTANKYLPLAFVIYAVLLIFHLVRLYLSDYFEANYMAYHIVNMLYVMSAIIVLYAVSDKFLQKSYVVTSISNILSRYSYNIYLYHCLAIFILKYDILPSYNLSVKGNFLITAAVIYSVIAVLCTISYFVKRRKK